MIRRIKSLFLVCLAYLFFLVRGSAKTNSVPKKFVILYPTINIGDMVCVTPLFHAIKKKYPLAEVTVIGSPKNEALLSEHKDVDTYIHATQSDWSLIHYLRKNKIDGGISINMDAHDLAVLFLAGVKNISCFRLVETHAHFQARPFTLMSHLVNTIPYTPGNYIPQENLRLLSPFGFTETTSEKRLGFSESGRQKVDQTLKSVHIPHDAKLVAIAPGAGSDIKRWPASRFAFVANYLHQKYRVSIVVVGGPQDISAVEEMIASIDPTVTYWSPGPQSLDELKAMLARALVVIGNDSGAIHIGEAVGTKTVTIAGVTDVTEHMRDDANHRIIRGIKGEYIYRSYIGDESKIKLEDAQRQMESVTTEMVIKVVDELLGSVSQDT